MAAQNPLNIALFGTFADRPDHDKNLTWHWFTSAHWRSVLRSASPQEEEATSLSYVADLRATGHPVRPRSRRRDTGLRSV
ncbi:hypothetical protein ACIO93_35730 [Streptomyces sp. NPDC087903]|uniref:MmyB family transcriptional regulator n=1 Tax=Streptomyces sp. NPDC087903 TaxID=3365819 RepID=UPI00382213F6